ncbi:SCO1431 family membrane protein [Streptomyces sp. NPDC059169]
MTASATTAARTRRRTRSGGPDNGPRIVEHVLGWTLVVVFAMLVTQTGLM